MNNAIQEFVKTELIKDGVQGKRILEVGSLDVNGSIRPTFMEYNPVEYIGIDIRGGPNVNIVLDADNLVETYGKDSFDFVVSSEMLEHTKDWRKSINNMKQVLRPDGYILITTRSKGSGYHGYPEDYWRYNMTDIAHIFSDFTLLIIRTDKEAPGVFMLARKPQNWIPNNLEVYELYSILNEKK